MLQMTTTVSGLYIESKHVMVVAVSSGWQDVAGTDCLLIESQKQDVSKDAHAVGTVGGLQVKIQLVVNEYASECDTNGV